MNDSIQNLHKRIKKEINVEIGRGNLIECRYPEILTENRHVRTSRLHRKQKIRMLRAANAAQPLIRTFAVYEQKNILQIQFAEKIKKKLLQINQEEPFTYKLRRSFYR